MLLTTLLKAAAVGFSAGVTPGPLQAVFLSYAVKGGWKKALPAAFAPLVSDAPVILIVLILLRSLPETFLQFLQIVGALFLLYLAWNSFKAFREYREVEDMGKTSGLKTLLKATMVNLLAPGPWLFWSLINGPNFLKAWSVSHRWGIAYLGTFYGSFILVNVLLIGLFSAVRRMGEKVRRCMLLASALVLAGFAVYQLLAGLHLI
ncbi:MAG: LysE family translocator [Chloroflexota bacterium]|jgi:threonine/homoserine/homoserine lactone efflux protein|nr:LysE family translocator [Chloroflexota bacterium]